MLDVWVAPHTSIVWLHAIPWFGCPVTRESTRSSGQHHSDMSILFLLPILCTVSSVFSFFCTRAIPQNGKNHSVGPAWQKSWPTRRWSGRARGTSASLRDTAETNVETQGRDSGAAHKQETWCKNNVDIHDMLLVWVQVAPAGFSCARMPGQTASSTPALKLERKRDESFVWRLHNRHVSAEDRGK